MAHMSTSKSVVPRYSVEIGQEHGDERLLIFYARVLRWVFMTSNSGLKLRLSPPRSPPLLLNIDSHCRRTKADSCIVLGEYR